MQTSTKGTLVFNLFDSAKKFSTATDSVEWNGCKVRTIILGDDPNGKNEKLGGKSLAINDDGEDDSSKVRAMEDGPLLTTN